MCWGYPPALRYQAPALLHNHGQHSSMTISGGLTVLLGCSLSRFCPSAGWGFPMVRCLWPTSHQGPLSVHPSVMCYGMFQGTPSSLLPALSWLLFGQSQRQSHLHRAARFVWGQTWHLLGRHCNFPGARRGTLRGPRAKGRRRGEAAVGLLQCLQFMVED